ncbi:MAG: hypothetical protein ACFFAO_11105 [Candidatus Hermodarchaeota archaeon]
MNFNENEMFGAALIGFDMIDGPFLKWKKENENSLIDIDDFAINFYLAFRGGNAGKKPRAILYDKFYIVAFPRDLELCCLFLKPQGIESNIKQLKKVASRIVSDMEENEEEKDNTDESDEDTIEEIKRLIVNLLSAREMSTPELRKYFKLSNSQIWKVISDLENEQKVIRTDKKKGRAVVWTSA